MNKNARTKGWTWDIPHCMVCKNHIRSVERLQLLGLALFALSFIGAFLAGANARSSLIGFQAALFLLAASALTCLGLWRVLRSKCPANCTGLTPTVIYLGSSGPCHSFEIKSKFYGAEFVRANHRKLVNVSPQVVSILRGASFGDYQVPRRIVSRKL